MSVGILNKQAVTTKIMFTVHMSRIIFYPLSQIALHHSLYKKLAVLQGVKYLTEQ